MGYDYKSKRKKGHLFNMDDLKTLWRRQRSASNSLECLLRTESLLHNAFNDDSGMDLWLNTMDLCLNTMDSCPKSPPRKRH